MADDMDTMYVCTLQAPIRIIVLKLLTSFRSTLPCGGAVEGFHVVALWRFGAAGVFNAVASSRGLSYLIPCTTLRCL